MHARAWPSFLLMKCLFDLALPSIFEVDRPDIFCVLLTCDQGTFGIDIGTNLWNSANYHNMINKYIPACFDETKKITEIPHK